VRAVLIAGSRARVGLAGRRSRHLGRIAPMTGARRGNRSATASYLMRRPFAGHHFAGIRALSRHAGSSFVLFEGRYKLGTRMVGPIDLKPEDPDVIKTALRLRLVP
jgi:hypothetical protein